MSKQKWLVAGVVIILAGVALVFALRPKAQDAAAAKGDPETRIIDYLKKNVKPGQPVVVTQLYNDVFTTQEERDALQRLYDAAFKIPAAAAKQYKQTGKIPTLTELSVTVGLKNREEVDVLLHAIESDPRAPHLFERDPATGEIKSLDYDRIAADERFGKPLR